MSPLPICALASLCFGLTAGAVSGAQPLATWTVTDHLDHQWADELVHFDFDVATTSAELTLTNADGQPVPCQFADVKHDATRGRTAGTVWTVVSVAPGGGVTLCLRAGRPTANTTLHVERERGRLTLVNDRMAVTLSDWSAGPRPTKLVKLDAPLVSVSAPGGKALGQGTWINAGPALMVTNAQTTVVEHGPIRVTVHQQLTFADGRSYTMVVSLGARQNVALVTEQATIEAPEAAFCFSFQPGLEADRIFWRNNYYAESYKGLTADPIAFDKEQVICHMRPWSFWWLKDTTTWAGFYRGGAEPFVGLLALRPSRWTPVGWEGFERTQIPITARPGGRLDVTFGLVAGTRKKEDNSSSLLPLHREWAITVGTVADYIDLDKQPILKEAEEAFRENDRRKWNALLKKGMWVSKLRRQLVKYSEFPLDKVKDFGSDFKAATSGRKHPYLLFTQADIARARRQAKTVPAMKAIVAEATRYMGRLGCDPVAKIRETPDGWKKFYVENYIGNYLYEKAPQAYVGSDDEKYGIILAAGVKGLAGANLDQFLEAPRRPSIGGNAHLGTTNLLRLLLAYDALADSGHLTAQEKRRVEAVLVFGAHVADHPDYWNTDVGLCSANPNMTSLLRLPLGLLALFLDGHPRSAQWLEFAEAELQRELKDWIAPGGAWLECPFYQGPSLDGMFLLSQAMRNVRGKDYFADPQFKATMDYYGFLLTPPDVRFPPNETAESQAPMTFASFGDAMPGHTTPFNGWMARATAKSDPGFSARQQFFWQGQRFSLDNGGRAKAYMMAICDAELPGTAPADLSRSFEGFGNVLRTSWTDPKASYVAHRCGYFFHHYDPGDDNAILYHAKGVPLCIDFAHRGASHDEVVTMYKPDYHSTVSFDLASSPRHWGLSAGPVEANKEAQEVRALPRTVDYSAGLSCGSGNQRVNRHVLLVKSDDPMGANYLVMRDATQDGQPKQEFFWNLWCLSTDVEIRGHVAHFAGQLGVDLDAHILSPANPQFVKDHWKYTQHAYVWGQFTEEQYGVHVRKQGSQQDFFAVLYPRAAGQGPAQVTTVGDGRGLEVTHMEGTDVMLLSPGNAATITVGDAELQGEIALVRRYTDGTIRLAVLKGAGAAAGCGPWRVRSDGPVAISVKGMAVDGETSGAAHTVEISLPPNYGSGIVMLDGKRIEAKPSKNRLTLELPAGYHTFAVRTE